MCSPPPELPPPPSPRLPSAPCLSLLSARGQPCANRVDRTTGGMTALRALAGRYKNCMALGTDLRTVCHPVNCDNFPGKVCADTIYHNPGILFLGIIGAPLAARHAHAQRGTALHVRWAKEKGGRDQCSECTRGWGY